jgi:tRNA pseudouridine55 synthase
MAEGVLPIAINEATKTIPLINKSKKTYFFEVNWGKQTNTLDSEGDVINISKIIPSCEDIKKAIKKFIGKINQSPPKFSAKKLMEKEHTSLLEKELNLSLKK